MKKILFIHGFGVMKDARGMFTDIAESLSDADFVPVLFDLNDLGPGGNIVVSNFVEQVRRVKEVWAQESVGCDMYVVAHSQGCIVAALSDLVDITKTIFLAPPTDSKSKKTIEHFRSKSGTEINLRGVSKLARSDGSFTIVPKSYWVEKDKISAEDVYQEYVTSHETEVIRATEDEVISNKGMENTFSGVEIRDIITNHDFTKEGRVELIKEIREILTLPSKDLGD